MTIRRLAIVLTMAAIASAQQAPKDDTGSISGFVPDAATGKPVEGARIIAGNQPAETDAQGRYELKNLKAGPYPLRAYTKDGVPSAPKTVTLGAGQSLNSVILQIPSGGSITGRVLDENKEPLAGMEVRLIGTAYSLGQLRHVFVKQEQTNDKGEYTISQVKPASGYVLMANKKVLKIDPVSDAPENIELRKKVDLVLPQLSKYRWSPIPRSWRGRAARRDGHRYA